MQHFKQNRQIIRDMNENFKINYYWHKSLYSTQLICNDQNVIFSFTMSLVTSCCALWAYFSRPTIQLKTNTSVNNNYQL